MKKAISPETADAFTDSMNMSAFFEKAAGEFSLPVSRDTIFDCRKITVAPDIIRRWYGTVEHKHGKAYLAELTRYLLLCGPKENKELKDGEIEITRGFLVNPVK